MKNVFFVQANMQYGKSLYLPYATGCLAAYAWQFEEIKSAYCIEEFIFQREPVEGVIDRMQCADIVAFSCCNWTFEYNKAVAHGIKKRNPNCVVIFGGHFISDNNDILKECSYVDYLIFGEGEIAFKGLLEYLAGIKRIEEVPNIAYRLNAVTHYTVRCEDEDLDNYLSPYLEGYFEKIIIDHPQMEFCAVIETNRGCPYTCAYCDWCYSQKMRCFPIERVRADIEWCARHKVQYIFCADSNFGIFERDLEIAKMVVEFKKKYGYPYVFNNCFAKNSNDTVFEISKLFYDNQLNKAATLSFQSLSPVALKNIGRSNFTIDAFSGLIQKYNENHIPTYTELILGLPGETYDSFCNGVCQLVEAGQQSALTVYCCQVYSNALMGSKSYQKEFGIKTVHIPINFIHASKRKNHEIVEYIDLVVSTKDMPFEDLLNAFLFCACVQCFHYLGLLKFFAVYLHFEHDISYRDFYNQLYDYIVSSKNTMLNQLFQSMYRQCSTFENGEWTYYNEKFGKIGWYFEEGFFMELISEFERFWEEIMPFLKSFDIQQKRFEQLLKYQKFVIRQPKIQVINEEFDFDFLSYFHHALSNNYCPLKKKKNRIEVKLPNSVLNWEEYGQKVMLFSKKKAGTFVIGDANNFQQSFLE